MVRQALASAAASRPDELPRRRRGLRRRRWHGWATACSTRIGRWSPSGSGSSWRPPRTSPPRPSSQEALGAGEDPDRRARCRQPPRRNAPRRRRALKTSSLYGGRPLLFYPESNALPDLPDEALRKAELVEFQKSDPRRPRRCIEMRRAHASRRCEPPPGSVGPEPAKGRANAGGARRIYRTRSLGLTLVSGLPAELVAREARCSTLEASGQHELLRRGRNAIS